MENSPEVEKQSAVDNTPAPVENASPELTLFDPSGAVSPSAPTASAEPPSPGEPAPEKRGRGRPRKDGSAPKSGKKRPVSQNPDTAHAVSIANAQMVVSALDLLRAGISGGACPESPELRSATVGAWAEYLESQGTVLPPWVQVTVVSCVYVAPAFATERGKGFISGTWAKIKGWWIARKG